MADFRRTSRSATPGRASRTGNVTSAGTSSASETSSTKSHRSTVSSSTSSFGEKKQARAVDSNSLAAPVVTELRTPRKRRVPTPAKIRKPQPQTFATYPTLSTPAKPSRPRQFPSGEPSPRFTPPPFQLENGRNSSRRKSFNAKLNPPDSPSGDPVSIHLSRPPEWKMNLASLRRTLDEIAAADFAGLFFADETRKPRAWLQAFGEACRPLVDPIADFIRNRTEDGANELLPAPGKEHNFDWSEMSKVARSICDNILPARIIKSNSMLPIRPKTESPGRTEKAFENFPLEAKIMLAELVDELGKNKAFMTHVPRDRERYMKNVIAFVFVNHGLYYGLHSSGPSQFEQRVYDALMIYFEMVFGMPQDDENSNIFLKYVDKNDKRRGMRFLDGLLKEGQRRATNRTISATIDTTVERIAEWEDAAKRQYFPNIPGTSDSLESQVTFQRDLVNFFDEDFARNFDLTKYFLTGKDGTTYDCETIDQFVKYIGEGENGVLPYHVSSVANSRMLDFFWDAYLLHNIDFPIKTWDSRSVYPKPKLDTSYTFERHSTGQIKLVFTAWSDDVRSLTLGDTMAGEIRHPESTATLEVETTVLFELDGTAGFGDPKIRSTNLNILIKPRTDVGVFNRASPNASPYKHKPS
ncbi:MAG: hypothetical protein JWQ23_4248 [Herminiimonas sp.]|nr:hypothetical protein [Herminiimonas sp.]